MVELSNATLTNIKGQQADNADLTVTINRTDLETVMMGAAKFDEQIAAGKAKLEGNRDVYEQLKSTLVHFELGFEILPGTKPAPKAVARNAFEQGVVQLKGE